MTDALSAAIFVDRDGTIIEDRDYCSDPKDVKIFPGVTEGAAAFEIERVQTHYHYKSERHRSRSVHTGTISSCRSGTLAPTGGRFNRRYVFLPRCAGSTFQLSQACAWNDHRSHSGTPHRSCTFVFDR